MIEHVARTSAEELRVSTIPDVEAGLADLHVRQAHHRRRARHGTVAALALALGLGWGAGSVVTRTDNVHSSPGHPGTNRGGDLACRYPRVDCLGGHTYRFTLTRPVQWRIPPTSRSTWEGGSVR